MGMCALCGVSHTESYAYCKEIRIEAILAADHELYGAPELREEDFSDGSKGDYRFYVNALADIGNTLNRDSLDLREMMRFQALDRAVQEYRKRTQAYRG